MGCYWIATVEVKTGQTDKRLTTQHSFADRIHDKIQYKVNLLGVRFFQHEANNNGNLELLFDRLIPGTLFYFEVGEFLQRLDLFLVIGHKVS